MTTGPGTTSGGSRYVPLTDDQIQLLTYLAFAWDCDPQQALSRALAEAVDALDEDGVFAPRQPEQPNA